MIGEWKKIIPDEKNRSLVPLSSLALGRRDLRRWTDVHVNPFEGSPARAFQISYV